LTVKDDLPLDVGPLRERLVRDGRLVHWEHHETIDSTNRRAAVVGREGLAGPVLVTAEHQSAGRGRQGRVWESPAHRNFYGSFVLCPKVAQAELAPITLVAALAVSDAIAGIGLRGRGHRCQFEPARRGLPPGIALEGG
jgi:hypothetical protein